MPDHSTEGVEFVLRRDSLAACLLLLIGASIVAASWSLAGSPGSGIGPGTVPKLLGILILATGALLLAISRQSKPDTPEPWRLRGTICVVGAVLVFAALIRPLGLAVAAPLAFVLSSFGSEEAKPVETVISALVLTVLAVALFAYALRLPIPVAPFLH